MVVHVDPDHTLLYFAHRADVSPSDDVEWWGVEGVDRRFRFSWRIPI
jgi:hypothetical protein